MNELKSYTEYAVSTPTADFVIGFDFNYGEDAVNVTVDDVPATTAGYTIVYLNETTIRLSPSVPSGVVRLQRETDIDTTDNQFTAGAKFTAQTMDENFEQLRHSQQEVRDGFSKLKDAIGFTNLEQTIQAVHTIANEVEGNVVQSQTLLADTTDQAALAQNYASTANSANAAAQQAATTAQQAATDVSTAEADVYSALDAQTLTVNTALSDLSTVASKFYPTLAEANADIANLAVNQVVNIGEVANGGLWYKATAGAPSLTKSPYDPLTQSKSYTLDLSKLTESVSATVFGITGYINKANGALVNQGPPLNTAAYFLSTDFIPCAVDDIFVIFTSQTTSGIGGHCLYDANKNFVSNILINPNEPYVYRATANGYLRFTSKEGIKPYVRKLTTAKVTNVGIAEERLTLNFSISGYINPTGGLTAGSGKSTDFIDVSGYDFLKIESQPQGIIRAASTAFYDADKVFLGRLSTVDDTFNVIDVQGSRVKYLRTSNTIETIKISGCSINKIIGTDVSAFKTAIETSGYYFEDFNSSVLIGLPWVNNSYVNKNTGALVTDTAYQYVPDIDISAFTHIAIYDETPLTNTSGSVFKKPDGSYISNLVQDPFKLKVIQPPVGATKLSVSRYAATKFYIIGLNQKTEKFKLPFTNSAKLINPTSIVLTFPFDGFYIRRTDGFMVNSLGFSATDFIDISAHTYIELSSYTGNNDGASPCFYDSNKQYISDIKFRNRGDKYVIKRPEGANYIRLVRRHLNYVPTLSGSSAITMDNEYLTESGESKKQALAQFNNTPVGNTADVNNAMHFLDSRQGFVDFQAISTGGVFLNNTAHLPSNGVFLALYNEQPVIVINGTKYALNLTKLG